MKNHLKILFFLLSLALIPTSVMAAENVGFANNNLWFSRTENVIEGENIKIYTNIVNDSYALFRGNLSFSQNGEVLGDPIVFSLSKEKSQLFTYSWAAIAGNHQFGAQISEAYTIDDNGVQTLLPDSGLAITAPENFFVDLDSDGDGLGNETETSLGTNVSNPDTDGDGYNDKEDTTPLDSKIFPGPDTDGDGVSDLVDTDIDNDGLYNWEEEALGTDPKKYDTDGDGVSDKNDAYPLDSSKQEKEIPKVVAKTPVEETKEPNTPKTATKNPALSPTIESNKENLTILEISDDSLITDETPENREGANREVIQGKAGESNFTPPEIPHRSFWAATFGSPITAIPAILVIIAATGALVFLFLWLKAGRRIK